jgi:hypothetical protein
MLINEPKWHVEIILKFLLVEEKRKLSNFKLVQKHFFFADLERISVRIITFEVFLPFLVAILFFQKNNKSKALNKIKYCL